MLCWKTNSASGEANPIDYLYILGTVTLTAYGQLVLKWQLAQAGPLPVGVAGKVTFLLSQLRSPWVLSGFVAAGLAAFCWMAALTKFQLSYAYPFMGLSIVLVLMLSHIMFREELSLVSLLGAALVIAGITMIGLSK